MHSDSGGKTKPEGRPLRIFVTADPDLPVPPRFYGGIERVIALLIEGLRARGHEVRLFAHKESTIACLLSPYRSTRDGWSDRIANAALIAAATARYKPDVIHSFGRLAYLLPVLPLSVPKVMSYQRQVTVRTVKTASRLAGRSLSFTGCSRDLIAGVKHIGRWDVIYNAVSLERFTPGFGLERHAPLVFLGRVEHIKGAHVAIEVARRAGRRLVIAGNVPEGPEHQRYFKEQVLPHVDGASVEYVGPVDDEAKCRMLSTAAAFLMPILWEEPFGIVMAEALACGTPVLGFRRGAVPEVVIEGQTGFVCNDVDEMVTAVGRVSELNREACRRDAEERFSQTALVDAYERLYQSVTHV